MRWTASWAQELLSKILMNSWVMLLKRTEWILKPWVSSQFPSHPYGTANWYFYLNSPGEATVISNLFLFSDEKLLSKFKSLHAQLHPVFLQYKAVGKEKPNHGQVGPLFVRSKSLLLVLGRRAGMPRKLGFTCHTLFWNPSSHGGQKWYCC